jgi:hypothetical protein
MDWAGASQRPPSNPHSPDFFLGVVRELYLDAQSHLLVRDVIPIHQGVREPIAIAQATAPTRFAPRLPRSRSTHPWPIRSSSFQRPPADAALFRAVENDQQQIGQLVKNYIYKETD